MPTLFEYLDSINLTGKNLMETDAVEKAYNSFMVGRGLATNLDTVLFAAEMNTRPELAPDLQYLYLLHSIKKRKRFGKWSKKLEIHPDVSFIAETFKISHDKATEYLELLSDEDIAQIRKDLDFGGIKKKGKSK